MSGGFKSSAHFQWEISPRSLLTCCYYQTELLYMSTISPVSLSGVRVHGSAACVNCCFLTSKYWFSGSIADSASVCHCIPLITCLSQLQTLLFARCVICDCRVSDLCGLKINGGTPLNEIFQPSPQKPVRIFKPLLGSFVEFTCYQNQKFWQHLPIVWLYFPVEHRRGILALF